MFGSWRPPHWSSAATAALWSSPTRHVATAVTTRARKSSRRP